MLAAYETASGQQINFSKSSVYMPLGTDVDLRDHIITTLGMRLNEGRGKYLGLPFLVGRNKREIFSFVKERVWKKSHGWKEKMLSKAGKEILIKAVLQSIPTYVMSVFLLPKTLCVEVTSIIR